MITFRYNHYTTGCIRLSHSMKCKVHCQHMSCCCVISSFSIVHESSIKIPMCRWNGQHTNNSQGMNFIGKNLLNKQNTSNNSKLSFHHSVIPHNGQIFISDEFYMHKNLPGSS